MRLYDTAKQKVVDFTPSRDDDVRLYVCGITPYDSTHLGHAHTYLAYDLLIRRLEDQNRHVRLVRNITDVDDSILPKARELGVDFLELAAAETTQFRRDMKDLDTRPPVAEPKATEWTDEMIDLIKRLQSKGHTYSIDGTTWFDVSTWPRFGQLSGLDETTMRRLSAERGGTPDDPRQRNPLDFILWQPSRPDEPTWNSPFGPGRPGWHIECSAMSMALLGYEIDLHGGGSDLIFPHHECELAQSEAATGRPFVRHWMHCGMVAYEGQKMSKSLGNLVFVGELAKQANPAAIRLALMGHHYRQDWEWHDRDINEGKALLEKLTAAVDRGDNNTADVAQAEKFTAAVDRGDDNTAAVANQTSSRLGNHELDPAPYARQLRDALDDDLDAPQAKQVLTELANAVLTAGDSGVAAAEVLAELCDLCGIAVART